MPRPPRRLPCAVGRQGRAIPGSGDKGSRMGNTLDVIARAVNALGMVALPLALGFILARRLGTSWSLFGIGAVTFVGSQILHIPFNLWVLGPGLARLGLAGNVVGWRLAAAAAVLGLSAGVFEEGARFLVYRFWIRGARSRREALMFGAGHGGIEALVLGGLASLALFQALAYRNADLTALVPANQVEAARAQLAAYWSAPWYRAILGAVERAFALCLHLSLAVLVLQAFTRPNPLWLAAAVAWHALADAAAVWAGGTWGALQAEAIVGVMALASLGIVLLLRDKPRAPAPMSPQLGLTSGPADMPGPVAPDRIDESRFEAR